MGLDKNLRVLSVLSVFVAVGLLASRINFSSVLGVANQSFTLFQFFAPAAGGFLGGVLGAAAVLATSLIDFVITGKQASLLNIARLLPLAFAAIYFGSTGKSSRSKSIALVPLAAIVLFVLHPIGGQAWPYAVAFWSIPILFKLFARESILAKSLGATLTAHSVGSVVWLYLVPTTPGFWLALFPVTAFERLLFAAGTAASYVVLNALFSRLPLAGLVKVERKLPFVLQA